MKKRKGDFMKFEVEKEKLLIGINATLKAVASKTTMPILECFLIETKNNQLKGEIVE